jgi:predicted nucleic acid-binding protein
MLKVISDTTPILSLLKIGKLELLKELYEQVSVPYAVYNEIEKGKGKPFYADLSKVSWIKIEKIQDSGSRVYFFDLDEGEAEVIILAYEQKAGLVIIDELAGRRYAKQMDIKLTGTLGILLKAKEHGYIDQITPLLDSLTRQGSWINPKLVAKVIALAGESRQ